MSGSFASTTLGVRVLKLLSKALLSSSIFWYFFALTWQFSQVLDLQNLIRDRLGQQLEQNTFPHILQ
jgi:hypothetical protein